VQRATSLLSYGVVSHLRCPETAKWIPAFTDLSLCAAGPLDANLTRDIPPTRGMDGSEDDPERYTGEFCA